MPKEIALGASCLPAATAPHNEPNMLNTYMTRYDYDYNRGDSNAFLGEGLQDLTSGHVRNRPLFAHNLKDGGNTIYQSDYLKRHVPLPPGGMAALAAAAAAPHDMMTAQTKGMPSKCGCPWNENPVISTYRDHYPGKWCAPAAAGAAYAGASQNTYDPDFLRIDSPDDDGVGKATKRRTVGDGGAGGGGGSGAGGGGAFEQPSRGHLGDNLTVFGPKNGEGEPWETEYQKYGNPDLFKPQLLPRGVDDVEGAADTVGDPDKRRLLRALAGKPAVPAESRDFIFGPNDTNPIPMADRDADRCRVAGRIENEGNLAGRTTYQTDFVSQVKKPELPDPPQDMGGGSSKGFITAKPETLPPRELHPSSAALIERDNRAVNVDRHKHKLKHTVPTTPLNSHGDNTILAQ